MFNYSLVFYSVVTAGGLVCFFVSGMKMPNYEEALE